MAKTNTFRKILDHIDAEEIISKLVIDLPPEDINAWLKAKYSTTSEAKFVISVKQLKAFKDVYLDVYTYINEDIAKTKKAISKNTEEELKLAVQNNSAYKKKMLELANSEIDVRQMVANLCVAVETRTAQVFDFIQENSGDIDTRVDRLWVEYTNALANVLEKYYKFSNPNQEINVNHNIAIQHLDSHISVFHDVIKDVLASMDLETSFLFMEKFNEKMSQLKMPNPTIQQMTTETRLTEAKLLNESITEKLSTL